MSRAHVSAEHVSLICSLLIITPRVVILDNLRLTTGCDSHYVRTDQARVLSVVAGAPYNPQTCFRLICVNLIVSTSKYFRMHSSQHWNLKFHLWKKLNFKSNCFRTRTTLQKSFNEKIQYSCLTTRPTGNPHNLQIYFDTSILISIN